MTIPSKDQYGSINTDHLSGYVVLMIAALQKKKEDSNMSWNSTLLDELKASKPNIMQGNQKNKHFCYQKTDTKVVKNTPKKVGFVVP